MSTLWVARKSRCQVVLCCVGCHDVFLLRDSRGSTRTKDEECSPVGPRHPGQGPEVEEGTPSACPKGYPEASAASSALSSSP